MLDEFDDSSSDLESDPEDLRAGKANVAGMNICHRVTINLIRLIDKGFSP